MRLVYDAYERAATMVCFGLFSTFYDLISNWRHVDVEQQIVGLQFILFEIE